MPTYEVWNRRTKVLLGQVVVSAPEQVIGALLNTTGLTIEELASSLGNNMDEVRAALDIVPLPPPDTFERDHRATRPLLRVMPRRKLSLFVNEETV